METQVLKIANRILTSYFAGFLLLLLHVQHSQAQSATVNWNSVDQVIDGFGAATGGMSLTSPQAAFFFSTGSGDLGLSLLRTDIPDDGSCSTVNATCAGEVSNMQLAIANGAKVWSTPWSPPASMKTNGSTICDTGSGYAALNVGSYSAYATYLANYVISLSSLYSIYLYALSVQNEPDNCPTYDGAVWSAANLDNFIKTNLGPTFATAGLSSTLIMMSESSQFASFPRLVGPTMSDPSAVDYVGINAWHDYDGAASVINPYAFQNKLYWETEVSAGVGFGPSLCGGCWDPSMADALLWAQIVDNRMAVANANAWNWWFLVGHTNDNEGLVGSDHVTVSKRAYMLGNYSRFVRPGFFRIDATHAPQLGILTSAYKDPSTGTLVIVVINQNSLYVSQSFLLTGAAASSVTPWITSTDLNLAQQPDVPVVGGSFTYNLPGSSIVSFVGSATASIAPPSGLTAAVQ